MSCKRKHFIRELNPHLMCVLCGGYFIDATTIIECLHTFCKSCIVRYLQESKFCPVCDVQVHKTNALFNIRPDKTLQNLVYKLVPHLHHTEMGRRKKFYIHSDGCPVSPEDGGCDIGRKYILAEDDVSIALKPLAVSMNQEKGYHMDAPIRYMKCKAAITIGHIQKLLRGKFDLPPDHPVRLFAENNNADLCGSMSLVDVSYLKLWCRNDLHTLYYKIYFNKKVKYSACIDSRPYRRRAQLKAIKLNSKRQEKACVIFREENMHRKAPLARIAPAPPKGSECVGDKLEKWEGGGYKSILPYPCNEVSVEVGSGQELTNYGMVVPISNAIPTVIPGAFFDSSKLGGVLPLAIRLGTICASPHIPTAIQIHPPVITPPKQVIFPSIQTSVVNSIDSQPISSVLETSQDKEVQLTISETGVVRVNGEGNDLEAAVISSTSEVCNLLSQIENESKCSSPDPPKQLSPVKQHIAAIINNLCESDTTPPLTEGTISGSTPTTSKAKPPTISSCQRKTNVGAKCRKGQAVGYKTLKSSPKGWNPVISRHKLVHKFSNTSSKPNKFFKARQFNTHLNPTLSSSPSPTTTTTTTITTTTTGSSGALSTPSTNAFSHSITATSSLQCQSKDNITAPCAQHTKAISCVTEAKQDKLSWPPLPKRSFIENLVFPKPLSPLTGAPFPLQASLYDSFTLAKLNAIIGSNKIDVEDKYASPSALLSLFGGMAYSGSGQRAILPSSSPKKKPSELSQPPTLATETEAKQVNPNESSTSVASSPPRKHMRNKSVEKKLMSGNGPRSITEICDNISKSLQKSTDKQSENKQMQETVAETSHIQIAVFTPPTSSSSLPPSTSPPLCIPTSPCSKSDTLKKLHSPKHATNSSPHQSETSVSSPPKLVGEDQIATGNTIVSASSKEQPAPNDTSHEEEEEKQSVNSIKQNAVVEETSCAERKSTGEESLLGCERTPSAKQKEEYLDIAGTRRPSILCNDQHDLMLGDLTAMNDPISRSNEFQTITTGESHFTLSELTPENLVSSLSGSEAMISNIAFPAIGAHGEKDKKCPDVKVQKEKAAAAPNRPTLARSYLETKKQSSVGTSKHDVLPKQSVEVTAPVASVTGGSCVTSGSVSTKISEASDRSYTHHVPSTSTNFYESLNSASTKTMNAAHWNGGEFFSNGSYSNTAANYSRHTKTAHSSSPYASTSNDYMRNIHYGMDYCGGQISAKKTDVGSYASTQTTPKYNSSTSPFYNSSYNSNYMNLLSNASNASSSLVGGGGGYGFPKMFGSQQPYMNFGQSTGNWCGNMAATSTYHNCMNSSYTPSFANNCNLTNLPFSYYSNYNSYSHFYQGQDMTFIPPSLPGRSTNGSQIADFSSLQSPLFPMMPFVPSRPPSAITPLAKTTPKAMTKSSSKKKSPKPNAKGHTSGHNYSGCYPVVSSDKQTTTPSVKGYCNEFDYAAYGLSQFATHRHPSSHNFFPAQQASIKNAAANPLDTGLK